MTPADPAAERAPVARRAARAVKPGRPAVSPPPGDAAGGTSPRKPRSSVPRGAVSGRLSPAGAGVLEGAPAPAAGRLKTPAGGAPSANADSSSASSAGSTPRTYTIALPAGLKLLSLNDRFHWRERNSRAQELKRAAWVMALNAKVPPLGRVSVVVEYQPPDRRHRDPDNIAISAKALIDGCVAARCLPGDDSRYVAGVECVIGEPFPKGRLVLHLTEVAAATGNDAA